MQTFRQNLFTCAMLIGTIDIHHFMPLPVTLTLAEGGKVIGKQNLLPSFFCTLSKWYEMWLGKVQVNFLRLLFSELLLIS